jgi:hypothetical protein
VKLDGAFGEGRRSTQNYMELLVCELESWFIGREFDGGTSSRLHTQTTRPYYHVLKSENEYLITEADIEGWISLISNMNELMRKH